MRNYIMSNKPFITVFTPAYNRAHTIGRTYESLKKQKNKNFIWLIVDDGSTDDTARLVKKWQEEEKEFVIQYVYKKNGGMHTAHNTAYDLIDTELNICIDSDDMLAENAIEIIYDKWQSVKEEGYAGIIGLDADFDGNIIGQGFKEGLKATTLSGYYSSGGKGDKKLVYRTDIIKSVPPYPVFPGEKYVALAYKYVEYQDDGSSATMWKQYMKNPKGFAFWRKICMKYPMSKKRLWIDSIHYVSESIISGNNRFLQESPKRAMTIIAIPFGLLLSIYTRKKAKNL